MHDELTAFQRGQLIDPNYYSGVNFTVQMLQSYYSNDPIGPINASSPFNANQTFEQAIGRDLFNQGVSGNNPNVIIKGWQSYYFLGILTRTL